MSFTTILLFSLLTYIHYTDNSPQNKDNSGIYIYSSSARPPGAQTFVQLLPDDSIFYSEGYAIETVIKVSDLEINGTFSRSHKVDRYYLIDFKGQRAASLHSLSIPKHPDSIHWTGIGEKKLGIQLNYKYYNGENYITKDTIVNMQPLRLIRYTESGKTSLSQGAITTIYLGPEDKDLYLFPNIEKTFRGSMRMLHASIPGNQGELLIQVKFIPKSKDYYMFRIIKELRRLSTNAKKAPVS